MLISNTKIVDMLVLANKIYKQMQQRIVQCAGKYVALYLCRSWCYEDITEIHSYMNKEKQNSYIISEFNKTPNQLIASE